MFPLENILHFFDAAVQRFSPTDVSLCVTRRSPRASGWTAAAPLV